jgi:hypothetical protein
MVFPALLVFAYVVCCHARTSRPSLSTDLPLLRLRHHLQLFFARVLRSVSEEEVKALFAQFGTVYDVILFRAFQGAPTSRVSTFLIEGRTG